MAANFQFTGPACCCCKDFMRSNECRIDSTIGGSSLRKARSDTETREITLTHNSPVLEDSAHVIGPDWYSKKMYYAWIAPSGARFRWWNAKGFAGATGLDTDYTGDVTTVAGWWCDSLATHGANEHIYWSGHTTPYPDGTVDYDIDISRLNYDGTGNVSLATIPIYRAGSTAIYGYVGPMLVNRTADRLYYVVKQNATTPTADDWVFEIRYRDLATFTETSIYSVTCARLGADRGDAFIRGLNSLSFDIDAGKIYWCEHYLTAAVRQEGKVRRANLDGTGVELLYQSADPAAVNFARYSNSLGKIMHGDYDRTSTTPIPKDGVWLRNKDDWNDAELIALEASPETITSPFTETSSSYLWCGYEATGHGTKA
jgi:hypothetical protein